MENLGGKIDLILDGGRTQAGVPSTVLDCTRRELVVLREGPVSWEAIQRVLTDR
jgi:L-threonylcarbamoyladenylate synthase